MANWIKADQMEEKAIGGWVLAGAIYINLDRVEMLRFVSNYDEFRIVRLFFEDDFIDIVYDYPIAKFMGEVDAESTWEETSHE